MFVCPSVVDPRSPDLERTGAGHDRTFPGLAVAGHERVPPVVALRFCRRHIGVDLGLKRRSKHPAGAVTDDLIEDFGEFRALGLVLDYPQHRRLLPAGARTPAPSTRSDGKVRRALLLVPDSTTSGHISGAACHFVSYHPVYRITVNPH